HPKCHGEACTLQPTFGYRGGKALFCLAHKAFDMVDV
ncbi:unnamed protein product, partial [Choristocarpus tenellus]